MMPKKEKAEPPDMDRAATVEKHGDVMAAHASGELLKGQAECGELRSGAAFGKFQKAAKKVMVTNEVLDMIKCCSNELRQVQQDYQEGRQSSEAEGQQGQKPAGAKSLKARQVEAISAADAAATYSLRSTERGRVDPAAAAGSNAAAPPQKPALPADWGFLKHVDRLQAAPPAAAARSNGQHLQRPEQQYLSYDAATKAAHEAWQPAEEAGWRKVLTQKKHRQANKELIEAAERENAAKFIQATWLLHQHRKQQKVLKEQQLTQWAEEHLLAAHRSRKSLAAEATAAAADSGSDSDASSGEAAASSSSMWRRSRATGDEDSKRRAKPVVQPWARMIGREAPMTDGIAPPTPSAAHKASKWRGAVSATVAANKLADGVPGPAAGGQGSGGSSSAGAQQGGAAALLQEVPVTVMPAGGTAAAEEPLPRAPSSLPAAAGAGNVARTSSIAGALASVLGMFRGKSSSGGPDPSARSSSSSPASSGDSSTASKPPPRLSSRLSMDLAAFFGGGGSGGSSKAAQSRDLSRDSSSIRAPDPASKPPVGLVRRLSQDLTALFGGSGYRAAVPSGVDPSTSTGQGPSRTTSSQPTAAAAAVPQPPLQPTPPISRRRSVEFVRNLFRRGSVDVPAQQQAGADGAPAQASPRFGGRTADASRFVTAESVELTSQLPSPLLSGCATARTSWSDPEGASGSSSSASPAADLVARGAAAAAAYLEAATATVATREAVLSLCGGCPARSSGSVGAAAAQSSTAAEQAAAEGGMAAGCAPCSLSGGIAGSSAEAAAAGSPKGQGSRSNRSSVELCSCGTPGEGDDASGRPSFESIWTQIQAASSSAGAGPVSGTAAGDSSTATAAAAAHQEQGGPAASDRSAQQGRPDRPAAKPKPAPVVGQAKLGGTFGAVLVTAADVNSSTSSSFTKAGAPKPQAAAAVAGAVAAGVAVAAGSSLYASSAHQPAGSSTQPTGAPQGTAGMALAASSGLFAPTAPAARLKPPAVAVAFAGQQQQQRSGPSSPAFSDGASSSANSSPPLSPTRHTMPAWGAGASGKSPHPPKGGSSAAGTGRPGGPRSQLLSRQKAQKSADMSADAAAAVAAGPARSLELVVSSSSSPQQADAAPQGTAGDAMTRPAAPNSAAGRPGSAGVSSISQKLQLARRLAATAGEEEAEAGSSSRGAGLDLQLDGSSHRPLTAVKAGTSSSQALAANGGRKGLPQVQAVAGPLRPVGLMSAAAAAQQAGGRSAWAAEPLGSSLNSRTPAANSLQPAVASANQARGLPPATAGGSQGSVGGSRGGGRRSSGSTTPTGTLPSVSMRGALSGPVSPVGAAAGGEEGSTGHRPRRNSFSNDGSKPSGGCNPTQAVQGSAASPGLVVGVGG